MANIVVIGNACADIYVPPHAPPPPGGITYIPPLDVEVGGNAANTAVTAARLGTATAIAGVLGDDIFGRFVRETIAAAGVDAAKLRLLRGRSSPVTLVRNAPGGERSFVHHPGTNTDCTFPDDLAGTPCDVFHLAAPELLASVWPAGACDMARRLRSAGRCVTLDTFAVEDGGDSSRHVREHAPLLECVDIVFPNEEEARLLSGRRELPAQVEYFHERGVRVVAVKRGERGAVVSSGSRLHAVPASRVDVVDTCGAGDSFVAGFLTAWLWGHGDVNATRLGCLMGALCVAHRGALRGSADPERLGRVLAEYRAGM